MTDKPDTILFLSDARGQYIPRDFATSIKRECVDAKFYADLDTLAKGPPGGLDSAEDASEQYWDIWQDLCNDLVVTGQDGVTYRIFMDGDCWLIPEGMEWSDFTQTFAWPEDEDEDEDREIIEPEDQDQGSDGSDSERDTP